ncbi:hypothetical protein [Paenibacillus chibensis]|uniref:hypothetical protein n=1 Tax=Paenibacillus chibensis TaxID=59846 RepID=UPI000FD7D07F|nr:hypothetical protein [Paenibacillus chibensis]MEC0371136.1 hypothetical protein [Paenibacillus chibensis]
MFNIDTFQDTLVVCTEKDVLPALACRFLADFFSLLQLSLDSENEPFRLSNHGYALFVLGPGELSADLQKSMTINVEYVERIDLGDCQLFKVCLMEGNESFTFLFLKVGTQAEDVETWLNSLIEDGDHF